MLFNQDFLHKITDFYKKYNVQNIDQLIQKSGLKLEYIKIFINRLDKIKNNKQYNNTEKIYKILEFEKQLSPNFRMNLLNEINTLYKKYINLPSPSSFESNQILIKNIKSYSEELKKRLNKNVTVSVEELQKVYQINNEYIIIKYMDSILSKINKKNGQDLYELFLIKVFVPLEGIQNKMLRNTLMQLKDAQKNKNIELVKKYSETLKLLYNKILNDKINKIIGKIEDEKLQKILNKINRATLSKNFELVYKLRKLLGKTILEIQGKLLEKLDNDKKNKKEMSKLIKKL